MCARAPPATEDAGDMNQDDLCMLAELLDWQPDLAAGHPDFA